MKTLNFYAVLLFSIFAVNFSFAQTSVKKETIKVWGNCGMCKKVIEKAAKSAGATAANWNEDNKELKVTYASNKTDNAKIQKAIAKSGYDTQDFMGDDKAYDKLPGCCHYERKTASGNPGTEAMKCCDNEKCGTMKDCCKGMDCCKDKACSKKDGVAMNNCTHGKNGKSATACKGMTTGKGCCKS